MALVFLTCTKYVNQRGKKWKYAHLFQTGIFTIRNVHIYEKHECMSLNLAVDILNNEEYNSMAWILLELLHVLKLIYDAGVHIIHSTNHYYYKEHGLEIILANFQPAITRKKIFIALTSGKLYKIWDLTISSFTQACKSRPFSVQLIACEQWRMPSSFMKEN